MSNNLLVAKQIPAEFRRQLLNDNIIYKAVADTGDGHMAILIIIYRTYIFTDEPPIDINNPCLKCLAKILKIFQTIQPELVILEKESKLLAEL